MLTDLKDFPPERESKLREICRFSMFQTMFYRSNLWMHSHRVYWLAEALLPIAKGYIDLDIEKTKYLALVHDDAEIVTGDVQAGHKDKMSPEELAMVRKNEERAIDELAKKYPKFINIYIYKDLLTQALKKASLEAQFVSYIDKLDAYCESMHEVLAGNITFLRPVLFYVRTLEKLPQKFPNLNKFIGNKESSDTYLNDVIFPDFIGNGKYLHLNKPYTKESIHLESDFPFYDFWKKIVIKNAGEEGLRWLIKQKEFLD